jgi:hypothetical protein
MLGVIELGSNQSWFESAAGSTCRSAGRFKSFTRHARQGGRAVEGTPSELLVQEPSEAGLFFIAVALARHARKMKHCAQAKVEKLADFDWTTYYDKQTQEKLLAGCEL